MIEALLVVGLSFFNPTMPADSLGIQTIDGKVFVIHKVDEKETLYGISRRYGTTVEAIIQYNPTADAGLEIGQILKVPYTKRTTARTGNGQTIHTVAEKETLYAVSRLYNVSVDDIRQWNSLTSDALSVGQELVIKRTNTVDTRPVTTSPNVQVNVQKGVHQVVEKETLFSISRQYNVTIDDLRKWNNLEGTDLKIGQLLFVTPPTNTNTVIAATTTPQNKTVQEEVKPVEVKTPEVTSQQTTTPTTEVPTGEVKTRTITISENIRDGDEVVQSGLAELIEGTEANRKYLALHRSAPVGTILKVRNEMNNREVFVRVMGKLQDTAGTDKLIIKISKSAYDRLGAIDPRFRVEVTYYK